MEITAGTGSEAYQALICELLEHGQVTSPRGNATHEIRNVTITITDPREVHVLRTVRRPSAAIAATEALHLIGGFSSLVQLDKASGGNFTQFAKGGRLRGAYGPRAFCRLEQVITKLTADPDSRQAVATVWDGTEADAGNDVPCTTSLQFFIRSGHLEMRTSMRSNDLWLGVPYDFETFSAVHRTIARALQVTPGPYTHTVGSMHIYETDVLRADHVLNVKLQEPNRSSAPVIVTPDEDGSPVQRWNRYRYAAAQVALRQPDDKLKWNEWYTAHVPELPALHSGWDICDGCRYVVTMDSGCDECDA